MQISRVWFRLCTIVIALAFLLEDPMHHLAHALAPRSPLAHPSVEIQVTESKLNAFTAANGVRSRLFLDEAAAKMAGYPGRILPGALTLNLPMARLLARHPNYVQESHETKLSRPVFLNESLTVSMELLETSGERLHYGIVGKKQGGSIAVRSDVWLRPMTETEKASRQSLIHTVATAGERVAQRWAERMAAKSVDPLPDLPLLDFQAGDLREYKYPLTDARVFANMGVFGSAAGIEAEIADAIVGATVTRAMPGFVGAAFKVNRANAQAPMVLGDALVAKLTVLHVGMSGNQKQEAECVIEVINQAGKIVFESQVTMTRVVEPSASGLPVEFAPGQNPAELLQRLRARFGQDPATIGRELYNKFLAKPNVLRIKHGGGDWEAAARRNDALLDFLRNSGDKELQAIYEAIEDAYLAHVEYFIQERIAPWAFRYDLLDVPPFDIHRDMALQGLVGTQFKQINGGSGFSSKAWLRMNAMLAKMSSGVTLAALNVLSSLAPDPMEAPLEDPVAEEQRRRVLVKLLHGELVANFALTEPHAGSDTSGMESKVKDGCVKGEKVFITEGMILPPDYQDILGLPQRLVSMDQIPEPLRVKRSRLGEDLTLWQDLSDQVRRNAKLYKPMEHWLVFAARTKPANPSDLHEGIDALLIKIKDADFLPARETKGANELRFSEFVTGAKMEMTGQRASATTHFKVEELPVDLTRDNLGDYKKVMLETLSRGRYTISAHALGIIQGLKEVLAAAIQERTAQGMAVIASAQQMLEEMNALDKLYTQLLEQGAQIKDAGKDIRVPAAMAKILITTSATNLCRRMPEMLATMGYVSESRIEGLPEPFANPVEYADMRLRDVKLLEIGEGTSQIQELITLKELLAKTPPTQYADELAALQADTADAALAASIAQIVGLRNDALKIYRQDKNVEQWILTGTGGDDVSIRNLKLYFKELPEMEGRVRILLAGVHHLRKLREVGADTASATAALDWYLLDTARWLNLHGLISISPEKSRDLQQRAIDLMVHLSGKTGQGAAHFPESTNPLFATLDDVDVLGKTVLVRPDLNVPAENGHITNLDAPETRVVEHAKTLKELSDRGAKVVVVFHQGRPEEPDYMDHPDEHAAQLSRLIGKKVTWVNDLFGEEAIAAIKVLQPGEILVLKPVRSIDPSAPGKTLEKNPAFVERLEPLIDLFVLDGFSVSHRDQPSVTGFTKTPVVAGRVLQREVEVASGKLINPPKPHLLVVGGGKVPEKLGEIVSMLESGKASKVIVGGRLGNLALIAAQPGAAQAQSPDGQYRLAVQTVGEATAKDLKKFLDDVPRLAKVLATHRDKVALPTDAVCMEGDARKVVDFVDGQVPPGSDRLLVGIGPDSAARFAQIASRKEDPFASAFVVGPLGDDRYPTKEETRTVLRAVSAIPFWYTGGGNTEALVRELGFTPSYTSLAGGALNDFKKGLELPGLRMLQQNRPYFRRFGKTGLIFFRPGSAGARNAGDDAAIPVTTSL